VESVAPRKDNVGSHRVDGIKESPRQRMKCYDALPRDLRDAMKGLAWNYSPVGMAAMAANNGVEATRRHMSRFDREHWRTFFREEFGQEYPDSC
jgi:hypothetical protein